MYRIHGSNEPDTIGQAVSSGCIRMTNDDVADLYERVKSAPAPSCCAELGKSRGSRKAGSPGLLRPARWSAARQPLRLEFAPDRRAQPASCSGAELAQVAPR